MLVGTGAHICERQVIEIDRPGVTGTIVLNDTSTGPCQATVTTINATVTNVLGAKLSF